MKRIILVLAALAAVLPTGISCKKESLDLKVMSFNIRYGAAKDEDNCWDNRKAAVPAMLADKNPDIFGVQEALEYQVAYINKTAPQYACVGVGRDDGVHQGEHMSIFYKKDAIELENWGTYWLSETPDMPSKSWNAACYRTATWALLKVKATGKEFFYVNTHLDHRSAEARKNGLALIVERIGRMNPKGLPMVLTGDLNVTPDDECLTDLNKIMSSARDCAKDSDTRDSYNAFGKRGAIIDYIYFSEFEKCTDFKVVTEQYAGKPYISDHYPVIGTLVFNK